MNEIDTPHIELYMYSKNQEFPENIGHHTFLKGDAEINEEWLSDWGQWKGDTVYTKIAGMGLSDSNYRISQLTIRQEDFGGIIYDPVFDRVFKVNPQGYDLIKEIVAFSKQNDLQKFQSEKFHSESITPFITFLKEAQLWPT